MVWRPFLSSTNSPPIDFNSTNQITCQCDNEEEEKDAKHYLEEPTGFVASFFVLRKEGFVLWEIQLRFEYSMEEFLI